MNQPIVGYHVDDKSHWVAQLACGHNQHVRHDPPWQNRPWVTSPEGRARRLGDALECRKCDEGRPRDHPPDASTLRDPGSHCATPRLVAR